MSQANESHFGELTPRMKAFREEMLDEKPYIDAERAVLATEAYREHQNQPNVMKRALMLEKILDNMTRARRSSRATRPLRTAMPRSSPSTRWSS